MTIAAAEAFLNRKLNAQYPPKKMEANALLGLLKGTISPIEAAKQYTSDISSAYRKEELDSGLWRIWILLQDVAAQFAEEHDKLAEMVEEISRLPDLVTGNKVAVKWSDLPILSWQWAEVLPLNCLVFASAADFTASSETAFWNAFENSPADPAKLNSAAIAGIEEGVLMVKEWVQIAGKEIYECEVQTGLPHEGLWIGEKGFRKARWEFWKKRAWWISDQQKLSSSIRQVAKEIGERMEEIEMAQYA